MAQILSGNGNVMIEPMYEYAKGMGYMGVSVWFQVIMLMHYIESKSNAEVRNTLYI